MFRYPLKIFLNCFDFAERPGAHDPQLAVGFSDQPAKGVGFVAVGASG